MSSTMLCLARRDELTDLADLFELVRVSLLWSRLWHPLEIVYDDFTLSIAQIVSVSHV